MTDRVSRREALGRIGAGLGVMSALAPDRLAAAQRSALPVARRGMVNTVRGPVETAKLGFTLSHEHICATSAGVWQAWPQLFGGRAKFIADSVDLLKQAKDEGLDTIVDVTTIDLGRDIRLMEEISRKSGVQVIAATGHWLDPSRTMNARTVGELEDFFVREIEVGIEGTDIKAGVIKVANGNGPINGFGEKLLRAAARASKATGIPITTHSPGRDRVGERQATIFESEGMAPSKVCIGHSDNSEADYRLGLAKRGYVLGMDQLPGGLPPAPGAPPPQVAPPSLDERLAGVKGLVDAGFAGQLVLSNDWSLAMGLIPTETDRVRKAGNPDGIQFVIRKAIPALKRMGVSDQAIRTMTVDSQKRFFEGA